MSKNKTFRFTKKDNEDFENLKQITGLRDMELFRKMVRVFSDQISGEKSFESQTELIKKTKITIEQMRQENLVWLSDIMKKIISVKEENENQSEWMKKAFLDIFFEVVKGNEGRKIDNRFYRKSRAEIERIFEEKKEKWKSHANKYLNNKDLNW